MAKYIPRTSAPSNDKGTIFILDDINITKKKIMSAKTDSSNQIYFDEVNKPGISNLISIFSAITDKSIKEIENKYKNYNYGDFKKELANEIEKFIIPIQEKYKKYRYSKELINILKTGAKEASKLASKKIIEVRKKLGIKYDGTYIIRIKPTIPQKELTNYMRRENLRDAFAINKNKIGIYTNILIADDIYTTGSTIDSCSNIMKKAGVRNVYSICIATKTENLTKDEEKNITNIVYEKVISLEKQIES